MKLLIDNALSPIIAEGLCKAGFDAVHVRDFKMQSASDVKVFHFAEKHNRVIISADTDFGALLALRKKVKPSFILIRKAVGTRPNQILKLLIEVIPNIKDDLEKGSVVTITDTKLRIRYLPISY